MRQENSGRVRDSGRPQADRRSPRQRSRSTRPRHNPSARLRVACRQLETIRDYAWERLVESGEVHDASARHCHHFLLPAEELGPGLCGRDGLMSRERISRDLENFRTSLRWAMDADDADLALRLVDALAVPGSLRAPFGVMSQRVAELSGADGHPLTPVALASAAAALSDIGENRKAGILVDSALELVQSMKGTPVGNHSFCRVCSNVSMVTHVQSDMTRFIEMAKAWKEATYELGDPFEISQAQNLLGSLIGDPQEAMQACEEALNLARELGGPSRIAYSSIVLASRLALVDVDRAEAVFAEALEAALLAKNDWVDLFAATQIGLLQARRGDWANAFNILVETAERGNREGRHFAIVGALGHLAILLAAVQADEAAVLLGMWSEHTGGNLDTSHPLFGGLSERYDTLMSDLTGPRREDLLRRVAAIDDFEMLAVIRQHLDGLSAET